MKKLYFTFLLAAGFASNLSAQWAPVGASSMGRRLEVTPKKHYSLDIDQLRSQLKGASKMGKGARGTVISVPTLNGGVERFQVFSLPVMDAALEEKYQLGSYSGIGIDDPSKSIRFSIAPNDFQSMIMKDGNFEFIEPQSKDNKVYAVFSEIAKRIGKRAIF